jgi:predicted site-specific integrase-resolvase
VSVEAFATYLAVSPKTVRKWIRAGVLPVYSFPPLPLIGVWRIRTSDALAFVERARFQV